MRHGVTEHRQQPVTLGRADMPLVAVHDAQHQVAVAAHQQPVGLRLHPGRQHRRIHQIGEQDRQPPDLTGIARGGQQILGLGVAAVDGQHLPRQRRRGRPITTVDRRHRPIQQLIDRRTTLRVGIAVSRRSAPDRRSRPYRVTPGHQAPAISRGRSAGAARSSSRTAWDSVPDMTLPLRGRKDRVIRSQQFESICAPLRDPARTS